MSHLLLALHEALAYHDLNQPGYVALLTRGVNPQRCIPLRVLPQALAALDPGADAWLSQASFSTACRRKSRVARVRLLFSDLDTYNVADLRGKTVDELLEHLLMTCNEVDLPAPSRVVWSGRGLQVKWLLRVPVQARDVARWDRVQLEICRRLGSMGADRNARDVCRFLRVAGTVNSKSGQLARVVYEAKALDGAAGPGGLVVYDFDELADKLLPTPQAPSEVKPKGIDLPMEGCSDPGCAKPKHHPPRMKWRPRDPKCLAQDRLDDVRTLASIRGSREGLPPGFRDTFVYIGATLLAWLVPPAALESAIVDLASEFAPEWSATEVRSCACTVIALAHDAAAGRRVDYLGKQVDPRYKWTTAELVARLQVHPAEQKEMKTIFGKLEAKRRDAARQRVGRMKKHAEGSVRSLNQYLSAKATKRDRGRDLRALGWSWKAIAEVIGWANAECARKACSKK